MKNAEYAAIAQKLLPHIPRFAIEAPLILRTPVGEVLSAICFDHSEDPRDFYVWAFFLPMCLPCEDVTFTFGRMLRRPNRHLCWSADSDELIQELRFVIANEALPFLSQVNGPIDLVDYIANNSNMANPHSRDAIAFSLARAGRTNESLVAFDDLLRGLDLGIFWQRGLSERALAFKRLLETDPDQAQRQLDAWTDESLRNLNLEKYR